MVLDMGGCIAVPNLFDNVVFYQMCYCNTIIIPCETITVLRLKLKFAFVVHLLIWSCVEQLFIVWYSIFMSRFCAAVSCDIHPGLSKVFSSFPRGKCHQIGLVRSLLLLSHTEWVVLVWWILVCGSSCVHCSESLKGSGHGRKSLWVVLPCSSPVKVSYLTQSKVCLLAHIY